MHVAERYQDWKCSNYIHASCDGSSYIYHVSLVLLPTLYYIYTCYYSSSVCPFRTRRTSPAVGCMFGSSCVRVRQTLLYGCSMWSAEGPTAGVSNEPHTCCMISAEVRFCHTRICPNSSISRQPYEYRHIYCRHSMWWLVHFWCPCKGLFLNIINCRSKFQTHAILTLPRPQTHCSFSMFTLFHEPICS